MNLFFTAGLETFARIDVFLLEETLYLLGCVAIYPIFPLLV